MAVQCLDGCCCNGGVSCTRADATNDDNSWDSPTHGYALGRCKETFGCNVTVTGLPSSSDRTYRFQGVRCCLNSEAGGNTPATGPAAPKPTTPNSTRATKRVRATPAAMVAAASPTTPKSMGPKKGTRAATPVAMVAATRPTTPRSMGPKKGTRATPVAMIAKPKPTTPRSMGATKVTRATPVAMVAAQKPTTPRSMGATKGVRATLVAAVAALMARAVRTRSR